MLVNSNSSSSSSNSKSSDAGIYVWRSAAQWSSRCALRCNSCSGNRHKSLKREPAFCILSHVFSLSLALSRIFFALLIQLRSLVLQRALMLCCCASRLFSHFSAGAAAAGCCRSRRRSRCTVLSSGRSICVLQLPLPLPLLLLRLLLQAENVVTLQLILEIT